MAAAKYFPDLIRELLSHSFRHEDHAPQDLDRGRGRLGTLSLPMPPLTSLCAGAATAGAAGVLGLIAGRAARRPAGPPAWKDFAASLAQYEYKTVLLNIASL